METKLEKICVSLETAKRLQEAGIVIDTIFGWFYNTKFNLSMLDNTSSEFYSANWLYYPAPTAEEINLPSVVVAEGFRFYLRISKDHQCWKINYCRLDSEEHIVHLIDDGDKTDSLKLCEVLATVAIWLKQNVARSEVGH